MSNKITEIAKKARLPLSAKAVLLALADRADDNGVAYPGFASLARDCGCGRRTVVRAINRLEQDGHISRERRYSAPNVRQSNSYIVHPVASPDLVPHRHHPSATVTPPLVPERHHPSATVALMNHHRTTNKPSRNHQCAVDGNPEPELALTAEQPATKEKPTDLHPAFMAIWKHRLKASPNRRGTRADALKQWLKLPQDIRTDGDLLIRAFDRACKAYDWKKENCQYMPGLEVAMSKGVITEMVEELRESTPQQTTAPTHRPKGKSFLPTPQEATQP